MSGLISSSTRTLNFVLVGEVRSGTSVVQTTINNRQDVVCHANLFHDDDDTRRKAHESYFGLSKDSLRFAEWFSEGNTNPVQYINHSVLDNPKYSEQAVGFRVLYNVINKHELWELFEDRCREGDFCMIHVIRNPIACFVSLKQAERSGVWLLKLKNKPQESYPVTVTIDPGELTKFCRIHMSIRNKLKACCSDCLEVNYRDLFTYFQPIMQKVFEFLELDESDTLIQPGCRRLKNRSMLSRINNLDKLRKSLPYDVREFIDAEDLF